ncbi:MAG TPA: hypothetical protein PJ994_10745 [Tepidiformaceae bacterium]|nr:hypothetical protein [Tepidiformaceae bacterium]HMO94607.1 hypothetical protein [Tepidiformaceae bacterium]
MRDLIRTVHRSEEGHAQTLPGMLMAAAGIIALGIGAANDTGWLAIAGGIVGGLGVVVAMVLDHRYVEADLYGRIEKLEKK